MAKVCGRWNGHHRAARWIRPACPRFMHQPQRLGAARAGISGAGGRRQLLRHDELVLFVRFTTDEGRKLTSDTKITIRPPSGDGPGFNRQTRNSRAHDVQQSADRREPRSRLKARAPSGDTSRAAREPATTDAGQASGDRDTAHRERSAGEEPPLQAKREDRPEWKPFR